MSGHVHFYLGTGAPEPDNRVNATCGQQTGGGVGLQTVDYGVIPTQHSDNVGGCTLPDEEGAVIWARHNVLAIAFTQEFTRSIHAGKYCAVAL